MDKLEEIYKIQEAFTEKFFKEKQDLTLKQVRNNKHMLVSLILLVGRHLNRAFFAYDE